MMALWKDLRFGVRSLRKNPLFAAVAILSLALGIGATTAMFSLIYAVVLDAYPYADHERTVNPIARDVERPKDWNWFVLTPAQAALYKQSPAFEDILGFMPGPLELRGQGLPPEDVHAGYLTSNDATFNRVRALIGRGIQPSDDGHQSIVVLSYKYWLSRFQGDRTVLGRTLQLNDRAYTVVGVMPERYTLGACDMYLPSALNPTPGAIMIYFAKLKPGVTAEQASAQLDPLIHQFAKERPMFYPKNFHVHLQYLIDPVTKGTGQSPGLAHTFPLIFLAVTMLLLIGCANCSILLLARGTARTHEFAVRSAVGASRFRIVRQLLVECLVISFAGAGIGVGLSYFLAKLPLQLLPRAFPTEALIRVNLPILAFSTAVAVLTGVLFGLVPAMRFSRPNIAQTMQSSACRNIGSKGGRATLNTLIGGQIALTLVLLAVAGAAITGFVTLLHVPLGYDPSNTILTGGPVTRNTLSTWQERSVYRDQLLARIAAIPGVLSVAASNEAPPYGSFNTDVHIVGQSSAREQKTNTYFVSPSFFPLLRIPLLRGRVWTEAENGQGLPVAVVNQTFARRYLPGADPVGRQAELAMLRSLAKHENPTAPGFAPPVVSPAQQGTVQIVGIVADSKNDGLEKPVAPAVYVPSNTVLFNGLGFLVHTKGDPLTYMRAIEKSVHAFNPNQKLGYDTYTLQRFIEEQPEWGMQRLVAILFGIFAAVALALAAVGLYSVVAYSVAQRTGEFGVRMALGAPRSSILALVFRSTLATVLGGIGAGLLAAFGLRLGFARWVEGSSQNPLIILAAALVLVAVALVASLVPARRASRIDPMQALRTE